MERSFMYRLERHWVWPHIMILALVCLVIDAVALGFGIVWLVKYVAGIEGGGTVFKITMDSLPSVGAYWLPYRFFGWYYQ